MHKKIKWQAFVTLLCLCVHQAYANFDLKKTHREFDDGISKTEKVYLLLESLLSKAKTNSKHTMETIACLTTKRDLAKGMHKSSTRAKLTVTDAFYQKDFKAIEGYKNKLKDFVKGANELRLSIPECTNDSELLNEAEIAPAQTSHELEKAPEEKTKQVDQWHNEPGTEGFPVVGPASPF